MIDVIKELIANWDKIEKITSVMWDKIRLLFEKGDKQLGFIRRKSIFLNYYAISQKSFIKNYAKYIIPTEYRGYLLESIVISKLYKEGNIKDADSKRSELGKINPKGLRVYNLYNTGILNVLFEKIDHLLEERKNDEGFHH